MKKFRRGHTLWIGEVVLVPGSMTRRTGAVAKVYPVEVLGMVSHEVTEEERDWRRHIGHEDPNKRVDHVIQGRCKGKVVHINCNELGQISNVHRTYRKAQRATAAAAKIEDDGFARGWEDFQNGL